MANVGYESIDKLFNQIKQDCHDIIYIDLKKQISDEMLLELHNRRRKGIGSVYGSNYDRHPYGVGLGYPADIDIKYLGNWTYAYIDVTPPNRSIFDSKSNPYNQDKYLDDPYGADLSSWINDGLVPDISLMYKHKDEIISGEKRGLDFANQSYYKKGYLDATQKYMNRKLSTLMGQNLRSKGYKVTKIK